MVKCVHDMFVNKYRGYENSAAPIFQSFNRKQKTGSATKIEWSELGRLYKLTNHDGMS